MAIAILDIATYSLIPNFVPFGVLYVTQDTGDLYIGTGSSSAPFVELIASAGGSPGGFNGDIQFNNNGVLGGANVATDSVGNFAINTLAVGSTTDNGISRLGAASLAIGNGTAGNYSGNLTLNSTSYVPTAPGQSSIAIASPSASDASLIIRNDGTLAGFDHLSAIRLIRAEGNIEISRNANLNLAAGTWTSDDATEQGQVIEWGNSGFQIYVFPVGATNPLALEECCAWYDNGAGPRMEVMVTTNFDSGAPVIFGDNAYCNGLLKLASTSPISWSSTTNAAATNDTGISRLAVAELAIGNGTQGDITGTISLKSIITSSSGTITMGNTGTTTVPLIAFPAFATNGGFWIETGGATYNVLAVNAGVGLPVFGFGGASAGQQNSTVWASGTVAGWSSTTNLHSAIDTGISRLGAASLAIGNGTAGNTTGQITATTHTVAASGAAPTSAGTAGTVGQIIANGGKLYFCSVTGGAGAATWNTITLVPII